MNKRMKRHYSSKANGLNLCIKHERSSEITALSKRLSFYTAFSIQSLSWTTTRVRVQTSQKQETIFLFHLDNKEGDVEFSKVYRLKWMEMAD